VLIYKCYKKQKSIMITNGDPSFSAPTPDLRTGDVVVQDPSEVQKQKNKEAVLYAASELIPVLELPEQSFEPASIAFIEQRLATLAEQSSVQRFGARSTTDDFISA
jgi:hypothetical protein